MANDRTIEDAMHTSLPGSPMPLSSNFGSSDGSAPDLERKGSRISTWEDTSNEMAAQLAHMPLFLQSVSRVESCVQTLSQTVAAITTQVTSLHRRVTLFSTRENTVWSPFGMFSMCVGEEHTRHIFLKEEGEKVQK